MVIMMKIKHKDYLEYEIPMGWEIEDDVDTTSVYCPDGEGALTLSYYTIMELQETLDEHISIMAKKFIDANHIKLNHALILDSTQREKTVLYGMGTTPDQWFIKLWIIARYPKVVFATYQSEKKTSELKKVDKIISSMNILQN
jgi:hypothetical protein